MFHVDRYNAQGLGVEGVDYEVCSGLDQVKQIDIIVDVSARLLWLCTADQSSDGARQGVCKVCAAQRCSGGRRPDRGHRAGGAHMLHLIDYDDTELMRVCCLGPCGSWCDRKHARILS